MPEQEHSIFPHTRVKMGEGLGDHFGGIHAHNL
jgi:hypothetical protein